MKKNLMKMDLQTFAVPKFTPDHAKLYEQMDGTIPDKYNELILKEVMENSKMMQLAKYEEMDGKEKEFQYFAEGPGAYWVGEAEKIKTSTAKWLTVKMVAKKAGVIVLASREYLQYERSTFFDEMRPKIAEAIYKKIDAATILNQENPFPQSIDQSAVAAGHVLEDDLTYDTVIELQDLLEEEDFEPNAFISTRKNRKTLREASKVIGNQTELIYDRNNNTLDGLPVVDLKAQEKGTLYTGDFDHMFYGIPYNLSYKISEEAQLSTIVDENGDPINLFEREMMAMRVTMDIGFMLVKDGAFAKIKTKEIPEG
ncbi:HK97 family phage major capsid protein [Enterococcus moraviensis ATCC BAA-383]|uniref:HK97 family phage major capsid protein n=1 Tax=Enterococcus moraviensis ATCC BAA-383 TaxID=1158609 RepID=R2QZ55_9ENTE|nr:phage major capsid protein [Enterococcus moraviensis]EOI00681.1 HK97 family phage major capsid protein [Enterococcus moraviensis ATCC BAA-383]EOT73090.1 HK97 family phage major capsid protein [Enterococcus moraviensis ATCC BAA-383]OJG68648.1 HK97 family phage major capsid protein [Enterococcus moraviensis]